MNRRRAILSCLALAALPAAARAGLQRYYRVSLLAGGYSAGRHRAGLLIELDGLWKTYWRVPGDAGIPPQLDWSGSQNAAAIDVTGYFHHIVVTHSGDCALVGHVQPDA